MGLNVLGCRADILGTICKTRFVFAFKRTESRSGIEPRPFCLPTSLKRLTAKPNLLTCLEVGMEELVSHTLTPAVLLPPVPGRVDAQQIPDGQIQL